MDDTLPSQPHTLRTRGEIGRGGIGRVLIAFDSHLGREVAVKELLTGPSSFRSLPKALEHELMSRFLREARVTAQLEHPSIVPVYQLGRRTDGTLYYTMKLVRGRTLAEAVQRSVDLRERLYLLGHFVDLCQAIAYAHSRGVIHRDIKPHNVMVGEFGETVVLDWGLAKVQGKKDIRGAELSKQVEVLREQDAVKTLPGATLGTPAYMSPEQAGGKIDALDARSDVWSLGVVLYEILTGRQPFAGHAPLHVMAKILTDEVPPVRSIVPDAPEELAAVAERALRRDKDARYQSAKELADEVQAFQAGERVSAYAYSTAELLGRFMEKHRPQLAVALMAGLVLLVFLVVGSMRVLQERDVAVRAERDSQVRLSEAFVERARSSAMIHDWAAAELYAATALTHDPLPLARGMMLALDKVFRPTLRFRALTFSGCKDLALLAGGETLACAVGSEIELWDVARGAEGRRLRTSSGWVRHLARASNRAVLASGSDDGTVRIFDLASGNEAAFDLAPVAGAVQHLALSADGRWLAVAGESLEVRIYDTNQPTPVLVLPSAGKPLAALTLSPDGETLALATGDRAIELRDRATGRVKERFIGHERAIGALAFTPDGRFLASAGDDPTIRVWNVAAGRLSRIIAGHETEVSALVFAPDGKRLFSAGSDGSVRLFNRVSGREYARLSGVDEGPIQAMDLDGRTLVVASKDKSVRAFDVAAALGSPPSLFRTRTRVTSVAISPDSARLAFGRADGVVRLLSLDGLGRSIALEGHDKEVLGLAFSPDGKMLASAGADRTVRMWDIAQGTQIRKIEGEKFLGVIFVDDGRWIAALDGAAVSLWSRDPYEPPRRITDPELGGQDVLTGLAWSSRRRELVVSGRDRRLRFADLGADALTVRGARFAEPLSTVVASPEGRVLGVAGTGGLVSLADAASGGELSRLSEHEADVTTLAFGPKGALLASASVDGRVRLYDPEHRRELARLELHTDEVRGMAFSLDGSLLATGARDRTVRLFSLDPIATPPGELLERATRDFGIRLAGGKLTRERPERTQSRTP